MVKQEWSFGLLASIFALAALGVIPFADAVSTSGAHNSQASASALPDPGTQTQGLTQTTGELAFSSDGHTEFGDWGANVTISPAAWQPGMVLKVDASLELAEGHLDGLESIGKKLDQLAMLVTAERTFDADGWLRLPSDERMSTLVTPTGLGIEGGVQGAVTKRFGYGFRTPVDEFQTRSLPTLETTISGQVARFSVKSVLPWDLPPGIYRLRIDFGGVLSGGRRTVSLNGDAFGQRPPARAKTIESHLYSPPIPASGVHVSGGVVDATTIQPRIPWVLLYSYNSNGYRGVVADEDRSRFAMSERNLIPDDVILPLYNERGNKLSYSLEPQFPTDSIDARTNLPWDYTQGELTVQVTGPDGKTTGLGIAPFVDKGGLGPTTKRPAFAAWRPPSYGRYTVKATGWIADRWGNRYEGGGTYQFWIAKRMTMATATFQGIGISNIQIKTSNGYSPHLFPEYITDLEYFYASAPRPGFMSRFLLAESGVRAPYWPTSPNSFAGQIGSSNNGDSPGDIYRLLGGVVLKRQDSTPLYGGYVASAFILPKGSNNNRVIAPGSEELVGSDGEYARFFLVGTRPGMAYEVGTLFAPAVQIDPIVPARVRFVLRYPDGREKVAEGTGDRFGSFAGTERWPLDIPGVYRFWLEADWQSYKGHMPGLPDDGGQIYVFDRERPAGATGLKLDLPSQSRFSPANGLKISGKSTAQEVSYAAVIPGAVIAGGAVPVVDGKLEYLFDPVAIHEATPTYDIVNLNNGKPEIGRVVHFTLFSKETTPDGKTFHDFIQVIMRGTQVIVTR